jgi:hypothetical protein
MYLTYDLLNDFAGPVAAIVGAFAASMAAWSLGRLQWRIAASQRDIALDKLKFDPFQRRYGSTKWLGRSAVLFPPCNLLCSE